MKADRTGAAGGIGALVRRAALPGAPLLALAVYLLLPGSYPDPGGAPVPFSHAGRASAALAVWMAAWWITEAIPVYATGLLPLVLLPVAGAATIREASAPYGNELIFLFLGGFILALGIERWGLHRRVAFAALRCVGTRPDRIVGGIMGVTAVLSMWMSNTAVAITMLPIAMSVVDLARPGPGGGAPSSEDRNFALCLLLGVAYASSIGGIGTLVGTPPNLFLASFVRQHLGAEISFVRWMGIGVPLVLVYLPAAWWLLTHVVYPVGDRPVGEGADRIRQAHRGLGPMRRGEWVTLLVFGSTASLWILRPVLTGLEIGSLRPLAGLTDTGVAMAGAVALFLIPVERGGRRFAMDWETAARLP
ncbi:MAG: anion permease [Acidobacteria bacterium]|nr:anion permease [Acidobacteriota bacterium]